jgi:uncharacterized SAM-binding protein YcdF (DUF218 family)
MWGLLAAVVVLVFTPLGDWFGADLVRIDPLAKADYIVVLGGDNARAVEAAKLYREGWAPKVIVSSDGPAADELAAIVIAYGVPSADVLIDRSATRTADHPAGVAGLAGVDPAGQQFILVTTPYHSTRAIACFEHFGYRHVLARAPDWDYHGQFGPVRSDWHRRWIDLPAKLREIVGLWYYRLRGWA